MGGLLSTQPSNESITRGWVTRGYISPHRDRVAVCALSPDAKMLIRWVHCLLPKFNIFLLTPTSTATLHPHVTPPSSPPVAHSTDLWSSPTSRQASPSSGVDILMRIGLTRFFSSRTIPRLYLRGETSSYEYILLIWRAFRSSGGTNIQYLPLMFLPIPSGSSPDQATIRSGSGARVVFRATSGGSVSRSSR